MFSVYGQVKWAGRFGFVQCVSDLVLFYIQRDIDEQTPSKSLFGWSLIVGEESVAWRAKWLPLVTQSTANKSSIFAIYFSFLFMVFLVCCFISKHHTSVTFSLNWHSKHLPHTIPFSLNIVLYSHDITTIYFFNTKARACERNWVLLGKERVTTPKTFPEKWCRELCYIRSHNDPFDLVFIY